MGYYNLIPLDLGRSLWIEDGSVKVDLTQATLSQSAQQDEQVKQYLNEGRHLWVSGGGTYLVNERFLLVLQRSHHSQINPGKFSLFTGRADNENEWAHPQLLLRELFEELILFENGALCKPIWSPSQSLINSVFNHQVDRFGLSEIPHKPIYLELVEKYYRDVEIRSSEGLLRHRLNLHINSEGDINALFLFNVSIDSDALVARDGEFHLEKGKAVFHNRKIFLFDLTTQKASELAPERGEPVIVTEDMMTEHLRFLVQQCI